MIVGALYVIYFAKVAQTAKTICIAVDHSHELVNLV